MRHFFFRIGQTCTAHLNIRGRELSAVSYQRDHVVPVTIRTDTGYKLTSHDAKRARNDALMPGTSLSCFYVFPSTGPHADRIPSRTACKVQIRINCMIEIERVEDFELERFKLMIEPFNRSEISII